MKDLNKKNIPIPESMKIHNGKALRYELRLMKGIPGHFNFTCVKGKDLFNENFYNLALKKWEEHYFAIDKINKLNQNDKIQPFQS